jgi:hypothetical protein
MPVLEVARLDCLGHSHANFSILARPLPPTAPMDGLLGLDFFRGLELTIDFRAGRIDLR